MLSYKLDLYTNNTKLPSLKAGNLSSVIDLINPLVPELNPSAQRCLPRFLLGILIFKGFTARRLYKSYGVKRLINPLTAELNPSAQRCLPRFFTGDFNF
jgi:hypothetical protein